jgi:transposase
VEAVQRVVERHHGKLRTITKALKGPATIQAAGKPTKAYKATTAEEQRRQEREQRYRERYEQAHTLRKQGLTVNAIARQMDLNRRTVTVLLNADAFPGIPTRGRTTRAVADFESYLRKRWDEGEHHVTTLLAEIRTQGYHGAYSSLWHFARTLMIGDAKELISPAAISSTTPSPRATTWWLFGKCARLTPEQKRWLELWLAECPQVEITRRLALQFVETLHGRQVALLQQWLSNAENSHVVELERFASGLRRDYAAVEAGITTNWSNGTTEGHVNRLKLLKRQMYGRAKFDLLRVRVLNQV